MQMFQSHVFSSIVGLTGLAPEGLDTLSLPTQRSFLVYFLPLCHAFINVATFMKNDQQLSNTDHYL